MLHFTRQLRLGSRGRDCIAVKRALARAGHGSLKSPGTWTPIFGPFAVRNLKAFQQKHGIPASGVFGVNTFPKLLPYFDAYSRKLYAPQETPEDAMRKRIVQAAQYFASIEPRVHYTQGSRRMDIVRNRRRPPVSGDVWEDCSSFATGCYWLAGAPDPNGRGYDGYGFTGTLCVNGRRVSLAEAKPGDLVFYGYGAPWHHVAIYVGNGEVISHGTEGGPVRVPIDYRRDRGEIRSYL